MGKVKLSGVVLATAVGLMFLTQSPLCADESASAQVKCLGANSCKGQSACQTASTSCKGQNSCKGKGWIMTSSASACTQMGGHVEQQ